MKRLLFAVLVALAPGSAIAADDPDLRCATATILILSSAKTPAVRDAAMQASWYFIGRATAADRTLDLSESLRQHMDRFRKMPPDAVISEYQGCLVSLDTVSSELRLLGEALTQAH